MNKPFTINQFGTEYQSQHWYTISRICKKLEVYVINGQIQVIAPNGEKLDKFIADFLEIVPALEDREFSENQIAYLNELVSDVATYVKRLIVLSNS